MELVHEHVEAGDLLRHGVGHLHGTFGIGVAGGTSCSNESLSLPSSSVTLAATFSLMALIFILTSSISRLSWFLTNSSRSVWYSLSSSAATLDRRDNSN